MTNQPRKIITLVVVAGIGLAAMAANIFWIVPRLHSLRASIDSDRASKVVIEQQQSNLDQLTQDLASIQTKQVELESNLWTFLKEDSFFSAIDSVAKAKNVTIDDPAIADATPNGEIISRATTIVIHGKLDRVLNAVMALQAVQPLIAIQQLTIGEDTQAGNVQLTLTATTLWK